MHENTELWQYISSIKIWYKNRIKTHDSDFNLSILDKSQGIFIVNTNSLRFSLSVKFLKEVGRLVSVTACQPVLGYCVPNSVNHLWSPIIYRKKCIFTIILNR